MASVSTRFRATDPRFGELLATVEATVQETYSVEAANVRELRHTYDRVTKIPQRQFAAREKTRLAASNLTTATRKSITRTVAFTDQ